MKTRLPPIHPDDRKRLTALDLAVDALLELQEDLPALGTRPPGRTTGCTQRRAAFPSSTSFLFLLDSRPLLCHSLLMTTEELMKALIARAEGK